MRYSAAVNWQAGSDGLLLAWHAALQCAQSEASAQCEGSLGELDLFAGLFGGGKQGIVRDGSGAPSPADTVFAGGSRHAAAGNAQALSTLGPVAGRSCKQLKQCASRTYAMPRLQHKLADESQGLGAVVGRREERAEKKPYGRPGEGEERRSAARGIAPVMKGKGISGGLVSERRKHRLHRLQADAELDLFTFSVASRRKMVRHRPDRCRESSGLKKTTTPIRSEGVGDAVSTEGMQERFRAWSGQAEKREKGSQMPSLETARCRMR